MAKNKRLKNEYVGDKIVENDNSWTWRGVDVEIIYQGKGRHTITTHAGEKFKTYQVGVGVVEHDHDADPDTQDLVDAFICGKVFIDLTRDEFLSFDVPDVDLSSYLS